MANFFVVFNQSELPHRALQGKNKEHAANAEVLEAPQECSFVKVEAASVKQAQEIIFDKFGGDCTTTPIVVTEAQWKSS